MSQRDEAERIIAGWSGDIADALAAAGLLVHPEPLIDEAFLEGPPCDLCGATKYTVHDEIRNQLVCLGCGHACCHDANPASTWIALGEELRRFARLAGERAGEYDVPMLDMAVTLNAWADWIELRTMIVQVPVLRCLLCDAPYVLLQSLTMSKDVWLYQRDCNHTQALVAVDAQPKEDNE